MCLFIYVYIYVFAVFSYLILLNKNVFVFVCIYIYGRNKQSVRWADPNAFWPGREDHVRLLLPVMTRSPAMVLFQHIEHSATPSPGSWPINHLGYSTSGDIEACKIYTL